MEKKEYSKYQENRMGLVEKSCKDKNFKPSNKELKEAYGYLDYCNDCGKPFKYMEGSFHSMMGNSHSWGCSKTEIFLNKICCILFSIFLVLYLSLFFYGIVLLISVRFIVGAIILVGSIVLEIIHLYLKAIIVNYPIGDW